MKSNLFAVKYISLFIAVHHPDLLIFDHPDLKMDGLNNELVDKCGTRWSQIAGRRILIHTGEESI
ncbi:hypothetical protein [Metabacillus fastidiosus]|uniref:hypothetical protein n=1 Tax=Metabacillus fastidiosus TaxID=1458 RepID=UPI002DB5A53B|nr:hypothetical protein [Metabacillus fastidiosus]MEC2078428.1 hypothetical protein [Metabacillus fastidiosus]